MNDIETANQISAEIGFYYEQGRANRDILPSYSLTCFRSLATVICNALDKDVSSPSVKLTEKIKAIQATQLLKRGDINHLHTLRLHGNKGVHREESPEADFDRLAAEAEIAAMALIRTLYPMFKNADLPEFEIADVASGELQRITYRAMVDRDVDAMYRTALFLQERAELASQDYVGPARASDGFPIKSVPDIDQAMYWFKLCADQGHAESMYRLGQYKSKYRTEPEHPDYGLQHGERLLYLASEMGNADALHSMGGLFFYGSSLHEKDYEAAREYYEKAAELNHPGALAQLGHMYASGLGCEPNARSAAEFSLRAAEAGFPQGQYNVFLLYWKGEGFERDPEKSLYWLEQAVEQDFSHAKYALAEMILRGDVIAGPEHDPKALLDPCTHIPELAPYALMNLAKIKSEENKLEAWIQAAHEIQESHTLLTTNAAPEELMRQCKGLARLIATKLREHVSENGPNKGLALGDLVACGLFDRNGMPVNDKEWFIGNITALISEAGTDPSAQSRLQDFLIRRAHIKTRAGAEVPKVLSRNNLRAATPKVGRNDDCPCGSAIKYKKCCG